MPVTNTKGGRFTRQNSCKITGPTSYANGTGQRIYNTSFGIRGFTSVIPSMSVSGTYYAKWQPVSATPNAQGILRWFVTATGLEVANAVDLHTETVNLFVFGG